MEEKLKNNSLLTFLRQKANKKILERRSGKASLASSAKALIAASILSKEAKKVSHLLIKFWFLSLQIVLFTNRKKRKKKKRKRGKNVKRKKEKPLKKAERVVNQRNRQDVNAERRNEKS